MSVVTAAGFVARWFATRPGWLKVQRWFLGGAFGALAAWLALDRKTRLTLQRSIAMPNDPIVIVSAARTPMGALPGRAEGLRRAASSAPPPSAPRSSAPASSRRRSQEVIMGCVLPAGQGQAPARQASLGAGLPLAAGCTTVNKMCGSGMKAAMLAHDLLAAGTNDIMVAGGMESMTNAPYLLPKARAGLAHGPRPGDRPHVLRRPGGRLRQGPPDGHLRRGLRRRSTRSRARRRTSSRSPRCERAQKANKDGWFAWEITPLAIKAGKDEKFIENDEQPFKANLEKIPTLKPAFRKDGTVTAANSSLDLRRRRGAGADAPLDRREARPRRRSRSSSATRRTRRSRAGSPPRRSARSGSSSSRPAGRADDVDLYEINEAFAVVTMAAMQEHGLPHEKVNVHGGACALGHPIGASGARILVTLIGALRKYGGKRGVASLCIGGGEATAMAIELA